ncbi:hypothetical protein DOQ43_03080 [Salmonella enterica subsp. enterica serovar Virchow]|nr:hypothetical protein [Salmonella enterica subsp. enterica serovar Virchow]EDE0192592.1 hypothetical protein [Salmonella enterica subsp. enterica serovar Virchow]
MCIYLNLMILIKIIRGFISAQQQYAWQRNPRKFHNDSLKRYFVQDNLAGTLFPYFLSAL